MNGKKWFRSLADESGAALVVALLLMVVIITMVPAAMQLTSGEVDRTENFQEERAAMAIAEAGLEHAKSLVQNNDILTIFDGPDDDFSTTTDNGTFTTGGSEPVIASSSAWNDGTNYYTEVDFDGGSYRIRVFDNDDSALCPATCTAGNTDPALNTNYEAWIDRDGLVEIETIGTTADGTSVTLRAKTKRRVLPTYNIPAAVVLLGPTAAIKATSNSFDVTGADGNGGVGYGIDGLSDPECTGVNGIATQVTDASPTNVGNQAQWDSCSDAICTWYTQNGKDGVTGTDGGNPSVTTGATTITDVMVESMYNDFITEGSPDYSTTGSGPYTMTGGVYGSVTDPVTVYFDDKVKIAGGNTVTGYGVLVIDGDLELLGTINWHGIIMIGNCTTCVCPTCPGGLNGNGTVTTNGTVLIGNSTIEASTAEFTGNATLNYSCEGIQIANGAFKDSFAMTSWRRVE